MKVTADIQAYVRDVISGRHEPEGVRRLGDFYWRSVLVAALVVILGAVAYGVWDLLGVLEDLNSSPDTSAPPPPALNRSMLDDTVQQFQTRQSQFTDLKSVPLLTIPDPSR